MEVSAYPLSPPNSPLSWSSSKCCQDDAVVATETEIQVAPTTSLDSNLIMSHDATPVSCDLITNGDSTPVSCDLATNSGSHDSTPVSCDTNDLIVTENMRKEEEELKDERENKEVKEDGGGRLLDAQRYARLQHLLEKSSIYSKLLLKKMENQMEQNIKAASRKKRKRKVVRKAIETRSRTANQKSGTPTNDQATPSNSQDTPSSSQDTPSNKPRRSIRKQSEKVALSKSRKRKVEDSNYDLSDFVNKEGRLKKRRVEDTVSSADMDTRPSADKDTRPDTTDAKSVAIEDANVEEEERQFEGQPIPLNQPKLVTGGIMRPYQLDGMEWLKVLWENGVNGILGDEMGLGKTLQCIALIAHLIEMGVKGPFLVSAPLSTISNWVAEFKRFAPTIPVYLYHGTIMERQLLRRKIFPRHSKKNPKGSTLPVVITSYEICMRDQNYLADRSWKFLIVDEGHRIKNLNCKLIKILKTYDSANRLLLTGTPLQNNLSELWSLLNFLLPDIFDDLSSFQSWFDFSTVVHEENASAHILAREREEHVLTTLHEILTPFLLRRLKSDVELKIPPKKEVLVYAPLTEKQEWYYTGILMKNVLDLIEVEKKKKLVERGEVVTMEEETEKENVAQQDGEVWEEGRRRSSRTRTKRCLEISDDQFEAVLNGELDAQELLNKFKPKETKKALPPTSVLNIKMQGPWFMLRKCVNHPYLLEFPLTEDGQFKIDEEIVRCSGKMLLLDRMLPVLLERGHKVLIFSQSTQLLDILEDYFELREVRSARLDGSMGYQEREIEITRFSKSPDTNVFLLSTRAGGLGINLTVADTVIIYDSDWNPQCDLQAQDRCHRIGQTKPVVIYRFVTANTIDQHIVERAAGKRRLEKMVIHKGKFKGYNKDNKTLSLDDLMELLKSVDHDKIVTHDKTSQGHVISDSALEMLLDRSFVNSSKEEGVSSGCDNGNNLFRVIEEGNSCNGLQSVNMEEAKLLTNEESVSSQTPSVDSLVIKPLDDPVSIQDSTMISSLSTKENEE